MTASPAFADRLLRWFDAHGRHDLPWQNPRTPYRVWVSEIMLQQTQVNTVKAYFERFMARFPTLEALAAAPLDAVLAQWAGLGYYARARHLHAAARVMVAQGIPDTLACWLALPGVGASTAAAIMAQAFDEPATILDGNVKRVMARHAGIDTPIEQAATIHRLYDCARAYTPAYRSADYTQAIMDLGATLCTRSQPQCSDCPVSADCVAWQEGRVDELPARRVRRSLPVRTTTFLALFDADERIWLTRRPSVGLWGGLWCLPECRVSADHGLPAAGESISPVCANATAAVPWAQFAHRFTHFELRASVRKTTKADSVGLADDGAWFEVNRLLAARDIGLPKPIQTLLAANFPPNESIH
ncbi:A/G-specific adenine glycosylase [Halothiobacillus sp. DCM-1]|uniref:A/G-specific adenine glycosylase n=1 Tax=Halothiobacillus sp. DCM-1 TaxID=3112558 RepID=UPI00324A8A1A